MFDDLYRNERANSLSQMAQRPEESPKETGFFEDLTNPKTWEGMPRAAGLGVMYGGARVAQGVGLAGAVIPMAIDAIAGKDNYGDKTLTEQYFDAYTKTVNPALDYWKLPTEGVGKAGEIVHGLAGIALPLVAAGGNPDLLMLTQGMGTAADLSANGVDGQTAASGAMVSAFTTGIGMKLPMAGKTLAESFALGVGGNVGVGVLDRAAMKAMLQHQDYDSIAAQYKPFDPTQMALDAFIGASFGAFAHITKATEPSRKLTPDEQAAVLVMNEVRTHDADTLTRPGDIAAAGIANDAQAQARAQIDAGEQVSVNVPVDPVQFEAAISRVKDIAKSQLDTVGRTDSATNDAYVSGIVEPFIRTLSTRLGINPEETFAKYGAKVIGDKQGSLYQSPDHFLADFDNVDTIKLEALKMSEAEIDHAEQLFLSAFPENTTTYRRSAGILKRIRRASESASDELRGQPETARIHDGPMGPFSGYEIRGEVLPPDSFNPNGHLAVKVFGKEQVQAGLADEPALTFTVTPGGELTVNGPTPSGDTFAQFKAKGWADRAKGAAGEEQAGWSSLKTKDGQPMKLTELVPLLADVHARVREWRGEDHVGLHWSRATGALGGLFGDNPTAVFFQSAKEHIFDQTQSEPFTKWSNDAPFVAKEAAPTYDFKTGQKVVLEAYHGTGRPDRVGTVFNKKRATSGPMAFFTAEPKLASSYAEGKADTSLSYEDNNYANWFKFKGEGMRSPMDIERAWYHLDAETKAKIAETAPKLRLDDTESKVLVEEGNTSGNGSYDYNLQQTQRGYDRRGNPLKALVEDWLNSGNLYDNEALFMDVLKAAGFPTKKVAYDSPHETFPFVYKTYIKMQKPLVTGDIPTEVITALEAAAKRDRSRAQAGGADTWDKNTRTLREWVSALKDDSSPASYVWTSIPDKVTEVFKAFGYDGIIDYAGKGGAEQHPVYIPFEETQVKSAIGNKGKFDASKKDILKQGERGAIDPATNTISLFETADRSTFIHESGHHFLSIYGKIASEADAPAVIREDMASILQWLGVKDIESWNKLSLEEQRPAHEKFAEGFEHYMASGKAPKPELQGFFDQFASWMKEVYTTFAKLGTKFSPEVKEVMGRMFGKDLEPQGKTTETAKVEMPEVATAKAAVERAPDMVVRLEDGSEVRAVDALRDAEFELTKTKSEAEAFKADATNTDPNVLFQGKNNASEQLKSAMESLARSEQEWPAMSRSERIAMAADLVAQRMIADAEKKQQRIALTVISHDRLISRYDGLVQDGVRPFHAVGKMLDNVSAFSRGVSNEYFSRLIDTLNAVDSKFLGMIENSKQAGELVREIFGQDTGNKTAKAGAKAWLETVESMRSRFNRAGGDIGKLDYGYLPQPHDAVRVLRAGADKWATDILPLLDRSRYVDANGTPMNDAAMMDMLGNVWKTITEEGRNKMEPGARQGTGMRANKGTDHRAIHFKDADSYIQYAADYNKGGIMSAMQGHVSRLAKDIALVEEMGPNPEVQFRFLHDTAEKTGATDLIGPWLVPTTHMWSALNGSLSHPVNVKMAEVMQGARNVEIFGKLQSALLSSVTDLPTYFITTGFNKLPILDATINLVRSFGGETRDYANRAGLIAESVVSDMNRWAEGNIGAGVTGKLANATMKASLLEAWTDALRRGFSVTMMGALGKMSRLEWNALDAGDRMRLEAKGVTETDFKVWKMATPENWRGSQMLTAPSIRAIPEAQLSAAGLTVRDVDRSVSRLLGAIVDESEYASLAQDLGTRAAVTRGTKKGTVEGEFLRSIMLFKGFPMAMVSRHWGRVADQWAAGDKASSVAYAAGLMTSLTVFGALAVQLKDMANGKDPRDMTTPKFWGAAFAQGGGVGIFGDILYTGMGGQNRAGVPNWMSMAGPVIGSGLEFIDLTAGNLGEAMKGKETHAGAEALRFSRSHLPFVNMWYAKGAIDHAGLHDLQELLSPGYLSRMQDRARQDWNQSYYWQPGRGMPNRAPDLSKAGGQ